MGGGVAPDVELFRPVQAPDMRNFGRVADKTFTPAPPTPLEVCCERLFQAVIDLSCSLWKLADPTAGGVGQDGCGIKKHLVEAVRSVDAAQTPQIRLLKLCGSERLTNQLCDFLQMASSQQQAPADEKLTQHHRNGVFPISEMRRSFDDGLDPDQPPLPGPRIYTRHCQRFAQALEAMAPHHAVEKMFRRTWPRFNRLVMCVREEEITKYKKAKEHGGTANSHFSHTPLGADMNPQTTDAGDGKKKKKRSHNRSDHSVILDATDRERFTRFREGNFVFVLGGAGRALSGVVHWYRAFCKPPRKAGDLRKPPLPTHPRNELNDLNRSSNDARLERANARLASVFPHDSQMRISVQSHLNSEGSILPAWVCTGHVGGVISGVATDKLAPGRLSRFTETNSTSYSQKF